jgi:preprotein translocase subunit YajC
VSVAIVYFVILAVAFFFLIVLPQRRRVAAHRVFVASLAVGDEVITNGGIFGTVVGLEPDRVDLEVAPGVVLTVAKQALAQAAYTAPDVEEPGDDGEPGDPADADGNED